MKNLNKRDLDTLIALNSIYNQCKDDYTAINITSILKDNRVHYQPLFRSVLINNLLDSKPSGVRNNKLYKWNSIKPNIKMIERINNEIKQMISNYSNKSVINEENKDLSKYTLNQINSYKLLTDLYKLTKDEYVKVNRRVFPRDYNINHYARFAEASNTLNLFSLSGKSIKWNTDKPTMELAIKLENECILLTNKYRKLNKQKEMQQKLELDVKEEKVNKLIFKVERCKKEPKQYIKEFKVFGITIFKKTITEI